jgi:hypothetical protein
MKNFKKFRFYVVSYFFCFVLFCSVECKFN